MKYKRATLFKENTVEEEGVPAHRTGDRRNFIWLESATCCVLVQKRSISDTLLPRQGHHRDNHVTLLLLPNI
jgi:hypothetical protein